MANTNSSRPENLHSLQMAFAAHLRDPEHQAAPAGIEERRIGIYRQLFFNNINKFLSSNFPVLRQLYDDNDWRQLVRDFCIEHRCHTPLFPELPREFLRYVQNHRTERPGDPPFLHELAHYEWVELALSLDETELDSIAASPDGDLMREVPVLSPLAWPLSYRFPLHLIRPDFIPQFPPEHATHILAYRNREYKVCFMQMNDVTRLLFSLLQENTGLNGHDLLAELARQIEHTNPATILVKGKELLQELHNKDIILGTYSS
jgi:hypothetical protein